MRLFVLLGVFVGTAEADDKKVLHSFPGIDIVESSNHFIYTHGGPAPEIDRAQIVVEVRDARAHAIAVRSVGLRSTCDDAAVRALKIKGHELRSWSTNKIVAKGAASVSTPAGKPDRHRVVVQLAGLSTTVACAFAIDLVIDRVRKKIELPITLEREFDEK